MILALLALKFCFRLEIVKTESATIAGGKKSTINERTRQKMQQRNGSIKDMTDGELDIAIHGEYIRKEKTFRVDPKEYDKARARLRRLIAERTKRERMSDALLAQAETPETELTINDWSDVPFLSEDESKAGKYSDDE